MNSTLLRESFRTSKMMENILDGYSRVIDADARKHQLVESMNSNFNNNNSSDSYGDMKDFENRDMENYGTIKEEENFVNDDQASGDVEENIGKILNKKSFTCEHCGGLFTDPSNLQRHIRQKHIGARAHLCGDCGKTFATSSGLKQHRHTHSTYKPFTCPVCKKSYTQFSNLCRHKRMHADCRTRIKCDNCEEYFPSSTALNKHRRFCGTTSNPTVHGSNLIDSRRHNEMSGADNATPRFFENTGANLYNYPFNSSANDLDRIGESARHLASLLFPHPYINNELAVLENNRMNSLLFPYIPGSISSREIDSAMSSPKKMHAQTQCDDPESDVEKLSLKFPHGKSQYRVILSNANRFKSVERYFAYAPSSRHCGIQAEMPPLVETSPNRFGHCAEPKLSGGPCNPGRRFSIDSGFSPLPYALSHNSLSPRSKSDDETSTNNFKPLMPNNIKQFLDQIMVKQRLFQWASTLASAPNSHRNEAIFPYPPVFPFLPKFMDENEKPLDLSKNHCANKPDEIEKSLGLEIKNGAPRRRSLFPDQAFAQSRNLQYPASSMTENLFNNSLLSKGENHAYSKYSPNFESVSRKMPDTHRARYAPYSFLNGQSHGLKLYGATNGVASQHFPFPAISPRQVISMLNAPRSIYDMMRGDIPASARAPVPGVASRPDDQSSTFNGLHAPYAQRFVNHKLYGQCERERYVCKYCGKQFPRSANLTRHLRTHTGEQPYSCKFCDRCFSISSNLQRHVRNIHKKERPYTCQFCNKAFGQQTNLERHLRKHRLDGKAKMNSFSAEYFSPQTENKSSVNYASPNFMNGREKEDLELSPPNSIEDRNSSLSERHTSSDDESLDASFPTSNLSSERQSESMLKENTDDDDSINIVSTEE